MVKSYRKIKEVIHLPDLTEIQISPFNDFLEAKSKGKVSGLQSAFLEAFPIEDIHKRYRLEFLSYSLGTPTYSPEEAIERGMTYNAPLRGEFRLIIKDTGGPRSEEARHGIPSEGANEQRSRGAKKQSGGGIKEAIDQDVYLGQLPLMTDWGTFVINGVERVIVNQLRRSPGVYFSDKIHPSGKRLFIGEIIPHRGSWITFSTDTNDILHISLDRRHKVLCTTFLKALGYETPEQILKLFFKSIKRPLKDCDSFTLSKDVYQKGEVGSGEVGSQRSHGQGAGDTILARAGTRLDEELIESLGSFGIKEVEVLKEQEPLFILNTLNKDRIETRSQALLKIYALLRGTFTQDPKIAESYLRTMYFTKSRYNLNKIGRHRINRRFGSKIKSLTLIEEDFINVMRGIIELAKGEETADDPDHLGNRHLQRINELLQDQFRIAFTKLTWVIRERMMLKEVRTLTPRELMNATIITATLQKFFGTSQLSQFLEQTNPLAELTHKRRVTRLGPGGLTRETAGLEARDVHYSHYGRLCPIETPEGQNIGIITSLSSYARVNGYGEIEAPYRRVKGGKVTSEIKYLTAIEEDKYTIAQANAPIDKDGRFEESLILSRLGSDFPAVSAAEVDYMDISPQELFSITTSLIPFLEHDDANRALMGSNMQRQAVPLLFPEAPIVGTGVEGKAARDSGAVVIAKRSGVVTRAISSEIMIRREVGSGEVGSGEVGSGEVGSGKWFDYYPLEKFKRTNQNTCINQRPIVKVGDRVRLGEVIADGMSTERGKLALGRNILVAFMPWGGYNFEDAIVLSERLLKEDIFTSVTLEEFKLDVRDTALGPEEITCDIPNVSDEGIANLDERGIIRIGVEVEADDILIGKVSPKGERELTPEERLLQAIFGEKARDVKDTSLRVPSGVRGKVIDVRILSRKGEDKLYQQEVERRRAKIKAHMKYLIKELKKELGGVKGRNPPLAERLGIEEQIKGIKGEEARELERAARSNDFPHGVLKTIKVYIAQSRDVTVGDKISGRHGNKGTIAAIIPEEDMPYLEDGTPIELILNTLSVPSRMNIGQILESNLGWAARALGFKVESPVFDGARIEEIKGLLNKAGLPRDGKTSLFDGRSGERFSENVTVGYIYMMKLGHMVEDKIHARSIGSYALITQQPLGGKTQFGGQRFGEMEVWALEAYGAAYTLQEMLTIKSDDITGRKELYESIIKGEGLPRPGTPTSFNVLLKELNGLCLETELIRESKE
ncbi:DNA-directed RNA polymerase subunit beta [candidate division WOR-3 bacterium]|nr:DNA-directed RNA polymerase subunit beta [candidate division WOR-3 bacterium]